MAKFNNINEGSSGKIGSVVTYQMYGKSYMRSLPGSYRDAKSDKQLAQRQKMNLVLDFLRPFKDLIRLTFKEEAVGCSAFQSAQSFNLKSGIKGAYPEQEIDFESALLSKGSVSVPQQVRVLEMQDGLLFEWDRQGDENKNDTLVVMARWRGTFNVACKMTGVKRGDRTYNWKVDGLDSRPLDVWIAFRDCKERGFSNSKYVGVIR